MRIEALNSECLYSYGNKRARRPNTHSASFPISIPLWLPYLLPFLLTLSLSILRCSFPRSLPPSSASRLIYPLTFSFYSSPLLFSFFYHYPSFSSLSHVPRLPTTDSPYLLPLLLFPTTYQAILLVSHLSSSPTSPRFRPLLSFVFHPFPRRNSDSMFLSQHAFILLDRSPLLCPTRSHPVLLFHALHPVRVLLCALESCASASARACVRARKIHVGVTPNARCTHARPQFMGIFSVR